MKFQLNILEKRNHLYKTTHKEFNTPYFEKIDSSPIFETEDVDGLQMFVRKFNDYLDLIQIGIEEITQSQEKQKVRTDD